jgi:hypothetical protein
VAEHDPLWIELLSEKADEPLPMICASPGRARSGWLPTKPGPRGRGRSARRPV